VKAGGQDWYWHRLVAWCFSNPGKLTWAKYQQKDKKGAYVYQAGHLDRSEVDCTVGNLKVMTRSQNLDMYRKEAKAKYRTVYKG
jgi:hypothetical protein